MALTHTTAHKNAITDAKVDRIDAGTTNAAGKLRIHDAGDVLLVEFDLSNPAFGDAAAGAATANAIADATAVATGIASYYTVHNRDETEEWRGTVTATGGGGDMEIDNLSIATGQTVRVTSWTHTGLSA